MASTVAGKSERHCAVRAGLDPLAPPLSLERATSSAAMASQLRLFPTSFV